MEFDSGPIQSTTTTIRDITDEEIRRQEFKTSSETSSKQILRRTNSCEPPSALKPGDLFDFKFINGYGIIQK